MENTKAKKKIKVLIIILSIFIILSGAVVFYYFGKTYEFYNYSQKEIEIPGLSDGFTPQGMCIIDNTNSYLISGYMKDTSLNSRIYYVNKQTGDVKYFYINTLSTNLNKGHFCGIAMQGQTVWLVTDGYLFCFDLNDFITYENQHTINAKSAFEVGINTDFCYASNNILYIGEFYRAGNYEVDQSHYVSINENETNHAIAFAFNIDENCLHGIQSTSASFAISVPDQAQGICITNSGKVVVSTSYSIPDSKIFVYDAPILNGEIALGLQTLPLYVLCSNNLNKTIIAPSMSEGLDYESGRVNVLFESACNKYKFVTRTREKYVLSFELN
ncbi:MAG: hypothetical protein E7376_02085 [Clostridiales bacterium]|nr:hypothetical protein [Clostridiales bacterium]